MRILYFSPSLASFVKKDIEILRGFATVDVFVFAPSAKWKTPFSFIQQTFYLIIHSWKSHVIICQFGGYHSFLPALFSKILGKRCIIVAGGTDCVGFPKMRYGNFQNKLLGTLTRLSFNLCSDIWPVDDSLIKTKSEYDPEQNQAQGILNYCPQTKAHFEVIHNGYAQEDWVFSEQKKAGTFISVAAGAGEYRRFVLKGLDLVIEAAKAFPAYSFTIVGNHQFSFEIEIPSNVRLVGFADRAQLNSLFQEHQYYLQLSVSEGFPNAICEAMLCGCIPIGSNVAALPLIIGDTGYVLKHRNKEELTQLIQQLEIPTAENYKRCQQRIQREFPLSKRAKKMNALLAGKTN
jgi:glycosyltransferase involved in cell wall biosynthesis